MTDTFNTSELAEDKDLTIQQLRGSIASRDDQIKQYSTELSAAYARISTMRTELDQRAKEASIDSLVLQHATKLATDFLEGEALRALIEKKVEQQVLSVIADGPTLLTAVESAIEDCIESFDMSDKVEEAIGDAVDKADIDCEDAVTHAIKEALGQADIRFARRY